MILDNRLKPISHQEMAAKRLRHEQAQTLRSRYTYLSRFNTLVFIVVMIALLALILRITVFDAVTSVPDWTYHALVGVACALAASMIVGFYLNFNLRRQASLCRDFTFYDALRDEAMRKRIEQCPRILANYRHLLALQGGIYQYQIDALRTELVREEGGEMQGRFHLKAY